MLVPYIELKAHSNKKKKKNHLANPVSPPNYFQYRK